MLFNSLPFLYLFLPITYVVFWQLRTKVQRYVWLTITGYAFYSFWNPKFCILMALSTAVSYGAGLGFLRWKDARRRRLCLVLPIAFDLALLATFKYANFALSSANWLFQAVHLNLHAPSFEIVLPIGISFYTFHTITYIVDSYRGVITPTRNVFEFSCYVSLFSQLIAGPIVRFRQVEQDLENIDHANQAGNLERGWSFFILGMVKKVLIADSIAWIINPALARWQSLSTLDTWLCMLGYTYQLYFDFSGYSDMAVGLGSMFGIRLPQNFNSPYKATDISDFWKRWHISLVHTAGLSLHSDGRKPAWRMEDVPQSGNHDVAGRALARRQLDFRGVGSLPRRVAGRYAVRRGNANLMACGSSEGDHVPAGSHRVGTISIRQLLDGLRAADSHVLVESRCSPGYRDVPCRSLADGRRPGSFWTEHL